MEKFSGGCVRILAATVGAVVSKPTDMKTTSLSVFSAISTALCTPCTTRISPPQDSSEPFEPGTRSRSPYVAMMQSFDTRSSAASISPCGVMQTGQPGPITILSCPGSRLRRPVLAIAASWVPQMCMKVMSRSTSSCSLSAISFPVAIKSQKYLLRKSHKSTYMDDDLLFAIVTIIAGLLIAGAARVVVRWLEKFAETTETKWDDIIVAAIGTPVQVGIIAVSVYIALKFQGVVPGQYSWIISDKVLNSIYTLIGTWIIASLVHDIISIYGHALAEQTEGDWDDRLVEFLELAARYIIWFAGIMLILVNLKIDITPFLAGAGIAGLAFALAAQDIISNFFGGAIITMDKPFKVGDRVKIDTFYGDVTNIGPRSTRLRTLDYQIVTIPNNKVTSSYIVNYSEPDVK